MNCKAGFLALLVLAFAGYLLLESGGGADRSLVEESNNGPAPGDAKVSEMEWEPGRGKEAEGAALAVADSKRSRGERTSLQAGAQGAIFGRVVDVLSRPVVGAQVSLLWVVDVDRKGAAARVRVRAETDGQGSFALRGLEWGNWVVRVEAEGLAEGRQGRQSVQLSRARPRILGLEFVLVEGHGLTGKVVDPKGKAIAGAWVSALGAGPKTEVRSDEEGRFRFRGLAKGRTRILAWATGQGLGVASAVVGESVGLVVELPGTDAYRFVFSLAESKKEGVDKPGDVWVRVRYTLGNLSLSLPSPISLIQVPADGEVRTPGLRSGRFSSSPISQQVVMSELWYRATLSPQEPEARIELGWQEALPLRGRLVLSDGKPAAGVLLQVRQRSLNRTYTATSDAEGRFVFPREVCAKGDTWLTIVSKGVLFDRGKQKVTWTTISSGATERQFTVLRTPVWSGRVVDEKGQPVSFAEVWLHRAGRQDVRLGTAKADEDGAFEISLRQEDHKPLVMDVRTADSICPQPIGVSTERESQRQGFVLRLAPASSLEGVVVDKRGVGIPNVGVNAFYGDSAEDALRLSSPGTRRLRKKEWHRTRSNSEGRFRIVGMPPGFWRIQVWEPRHRRLGPDPLVSLGKGEAKQGLKIVMSEGLSITGRVLDEAGGAMPGLLVSGKFLGKLADGEREPTMRIQSGSDGSFAFTGLRAGKYELTTQLSRTRQQELGLLQPGPDGRIPMLPRKPFVLQVSAGSQDLVWKLVLPRFGGIRARLIHEGPPLERVHAELRSSKSVQVWSYEIPVLRDGLTLKRVLAGIYQLQLESHRFENLKIDVQVKPHEVTDLGLLTLVASKQVEGRVVDSGGHPLPGVWIGLDDKLGALWSHYDSSKGLRQFEGRLLAQSDGQGRFRIPLQGKVRVHAFKPGYAPVTLAWPPAQAQQGEGKSSSPVRQSPQPSESPKPLLLRLRPSAELAIRTPAPVAGRPATWGARLTSLPDSSQQAGTRGRPPAPRYLWLQSAQTLHFVGLTPGRYSLEVLNFNKSASYKKDSVQGESYHEVIQIQLGSTRLIKIP